MRATKGRKKWYLQVVNHRKCILCKQPIKNAYEKGSVRVSNIGVTTCHKSCLQKALKNNVDVIGED